MSNKLKSILSSVGVAISTVLAVISSYLAENSIISTTLANVIITISMCLLIVAIIFAVKVDYKTGVYECRNCGNVFKPTFKAYLFGSHTMTTRHLKCPECEERSWCKRKTIH